MISKETKTAIIAEYKINENDTGSPEVQVAILTDRINSLTEHMKKNPKDFHSQRGLSKMVGHRKQLLNYLAKKDIERYRAVIKNLGLRKKFLGTLPMTCSHAGTENFVPVCCEKSKIQNRSGLLQNKEKALKSKQEWAKVAVNYVSECFLAYT